MRTLIRNVTVLTLDEEDRILPRAIWRWKAAASRQSASPGKLRT